MEYWYGVLTGMVTMSCLKIILKIAYLHSPEFHGKLNKTWGGGLSVILYFQCVTVHLAYILRKKQEHVDKLLFLFFLFRDFVMINKGGKTTTYKIGQQELYIFN